MYSENELRKLAKTVVKKEEFLSQTGNSDHYQTTNFERQFGFQCRFTVYEKDKVEIIMRLIVMIILIMMMMMIAIITHQKTMLKLVIICKG